jgi:hypothetical protein
MKWRRGKLFVISIFIQIFVSFCALLTGAQIHLGLWYLAQRFTPRYRPGTEINSPPWHLVQSFSHDFTLVAAHSFSHDFPPGAEIHSSPWYLAQRFTPRCDTWCRASLTISLLVQRIASVMISLLTMIPATEIHSTLWHPVHSFSHDFTPGAEIHSSTWHLAQRFTPRYDSQRWALIFHNFSRQIIFKKDCWIKPNVIMTDIEIHSTSWKIVQRFTLRHVSYSSVIYSAPCFI